MVEIVPSIKKLRSLENLNKFKLPIPRPRKSPRDKYVLNKNI